MKENIKGVENLVRSLHHEGIIELRYA